VAVEGVEAPQLVLDADPGRERAAPDEALGGPPDAVADLGQGGALVPRREDEPGQADPGCVRAVPGGRKSSAQGRWITSVGSS
jgi:hypothetical protein